VFAGDESQEYLDDPVNAVVLPLLELLAVDGALEDLLRTAAPAAFERTSDGTFAPIAHRALSRRTSFVQHRATAQNRGIAFRCDVLDRCS
jgi:hypothetical protein